MTAQLLPASRLPYINEFPELGNYQTMDEIKEAHPKFFSVGAMDFFDSVVYPEVYSGCVFVTSEKFDWETPRRYTVRIARGGLVGAMETDELFQAWSTKERAVKRARFLGEALSNLWYLWSMRKERPLTASWFELAKRCGLELCTETHGDEEYRRMRFGYHPEKKPNTQFIGDAS